MLFSIVTPTRNNLAELKRCVGSVRAQASLEHEHILRDGASSDGTPDWLALQPDLQAVSERDGGMYDAINRGWAHSSGQVLSWLNSDEQYLPGTLDRVRRLFSSHPDVDVVWGNAIFVSAAGDPIAARREIPLRRPYVLNGFLYSLSCTMFFRRRLLDGGMLRFDTAFRYAGDMDLVLRLLSANVRFLHTPQYLSLFGIDGDNMCLQPGSDLEVQEIRRRYGAIRSVSLSHVVTLGRRVERLLRGCYVHEDLHYRFATDEIPHYRDVSAIAIGTRYSAADAARAA